MPFRRYGVGFGPAMSYTLRFFVQQQLQHQVSLTRSAMRVTGDLTHTVPGCLGLFVVRLLGLRQFDAFLGHFDT